MLTPVRIFINGIKIVWIYFWAVLATLILFLPIVISSFINQTGNFTFFLCRIWSRIILFVSGVRVRITGKNRIKPGQSYVIISNHQSLFDIPALMQLGAQFRWVIKKELRKIPLFGFALYTARHIFIDRSNREAAIRSIQEGVKRLPKGVGVLFFAEGTRSPDGKIHPFKKGGFALAVRGRLPVLPVTVIGSRKVLPKKSIVFTPGKIEVVVSDPIDVKKFSDEEVDSLKEKTREIIVRTFHQEHPHSNGNGYNPGERPLS